MVTAIVVLAIITLSVVVHELAHYANARMVGVPVRAFSVGMGPILWRKQWRGTEWRLSLLPIGGYVDLPGLAATQDENGVLQHPTEGLATKSLGAKLWVLVGGVIANFFLAALLLGAAMVSNPAYQLSFLGADVPKATGFIEVVKGSSAEALGVQPGDLVLRLNGQQNPSPQDIRDGLAQDGPLLLELSRAGERITLETVWEPGLDAAGSRGLFGVVIGEVPTETFGFGRAVVESMSFMLRIVPEAVWGFISGIGQTFTGQQTEGVAGPVAIVGAVNSATQVLGLGRILLLAGLINFSLAIFNLLPVPGLDGGRMLMATIIALRGRPFKPGQEEFIHFLGFAALMVFILLVTFNEVGDLLGRG